MRPQPTMATRSGFMMLSLAVCPSFANTSLCVLRVIGYQISSGRANTIARAGIRPKNSRIPSRVCDVCATFGT